MRSAIKLIGLAVISVLAIAGCRSASAAPTSGPAVTSTTASPVMLKPTATTTAVSACESRLHAWDHPFGEKQLAALGEDEGKLAKEFPTLARTLSSGTGEQAALAALTATASQLGADSQAALANPPPTCVPGATAPYRTAMAEANQESQDTLSAVSEISSGSIASAAAMITAANTALDKSNPDLRQVTRAFNAFNSTGH